MGKLVDLTGKKINSWLVLEYTGNRYWKCLCTDCNTTIKDIHVSSLKQGTSKSCGCKNRNPVRDDISGKMFGNWKVLNNIGDGYWMCECQCDKKTRKPVKRVNLVLGKTKSCGCLRRQLAKETLLDRYGETTSVKVNKPREEWQIKTFEDDKEFVEFIRTKFNNKPTFKQVAEALGVTRHTISVKVHKLNLEEYIDIDPLVSYEEKKLHEYIENIYSGNIVYNTRNIIYPYELDIYIPDKKLAFEFNGCYWHSDINVDNGYHQKKTLLCNKHNIRLIHIFEYEWVNNKEKIKDYISDILSDNKKLIYARNTVIDTINKEEESEFLNKYHLQGYIASSINIALRYNNDIVALMTFGKPRFNSNYQYEILRLCFKNNTIVVGGLEKMLKVFISEYKPLSIITYANLSKFSGNSYLKLGFRQSKEFITEPNYVWVEESTLKVIPRYKTQKHKLIEAGLSKFGDTEDEIMKNLGFFKIYDSGNAKYEMIINS